MNRSIVLIATALLLAVSMPLSTASVAPRSVLYEQEFAPGFVGNQQQYVIIVVPEGHTDVRIEVDCNLHVGAISIMRVFGSEVAVICDGLTDRAVTTTQMEPGYYYGAASFTGINGVTVRITGIPV